LKPNKVCGDTTRHKITASLITLKGRDHSEDLDVDERLILELILKEQGGKVWTGSTWLRMGCCEHGNEPSGSMKGGEFLV
jgi:uncharacterized ferritin-like protein (DUF455 family)